MNENLRDKISRTAAAIAHDLKTDYDDDGLILVDVSELLDAIERIVTDHIDQAAGIPIEALQLQDRHYHALQRFGIRTIPQLAGCTRAELLGKRGIGQGGIAAIRTALEPRGLDLAGEHQDDKTKTAAAGESANPDPKTPPDFFQAGHTYIQNWPDAKPEHCTIFRCIAVTDFPGDAERTAGLIAVGFTAGLIAMGFSTGHDRNRWSVYLGRPFDWAEGWTEYDEAAN